MKEQARAPEQERRQVGRHERDRRGSLHPVNLRHLGLGARRQHCRRAGDATQHYVDWYEARVLVSGLGIVVCSCLDAFFTLTLLQMGAVELNALMAGLIESDIQQFVSLKIGVTSLSVLLLVIHYKFRIFNRLRVEYLIHFAFAAYLVLMGWELRLLANPPL